MAQVMRNGFVSNYIKSVINWSSLIDVYVHNIDECKCVTQYDRTHPPIITMGIINSYARCSHEIIK